MTAITQIKRDQEQACEVNQSNIKHLEETFETALQESKEAPAAIAQSIQQINEVVANNEKELESIQARVSYLRRVILANRNDTNAFEKELEKLNQDEVLYKNQHQKNLEQQKSQQQEMENDLKTQISSALHQLRDLKFLQELRLQLDHQTKAVKQLIEDEKKLNSDDMTSMRHQIHDQREFYENDLKVRLETVNQFVKDFSDLHIELATNKIMAESIENRKQLQEESLKAMQLLRENEVLRKKHYILNNDFKISQASVGKLHSDYSTLKISILEYEEKLNATLSANKDRIRQLRDEKDDAIGDLKLRKKDALQRNEQLKQELLSIQKELQRVETCRSESYQKEYEVLDSMSQTATFILTAIDRSIDAKDVQRSEDPNNEYDQISSQNNNSIRNSKTNPRNLRLTKINQDNSQKSELSRLMLRLQNISKQMKEDALKSQTALFYSNIEKKDAETQTDKSKRLDLLPAKVQPPSLLERTQNPRNKAAAQISRRVPPPYKLTLGKSKASFSKKRNYLTQPVHH